MLNEDVKYCVYIHTFPNGKKYVGITSRNVTERWGLTGNGYNGQKIMENAIRKYGWDNVKHEVVMYNLTKEEACKVEIALIKELNTTNIEFGYNSSPGGEMPDNSLKVKVICLNTLEVFSSAMEASRATGANNTKICMACRGERHSAGTDKLTGEPLMWEYYDQNKNYTKQHYPEEYKIIKKQVLCVETNKIYSCALDASKDLGIKKHTIYGSCKTGNAAFGYHFKYIT